MKTQNIRNYGTMIHLSCFAGYIFPFGNIIAPLILWSMKKDESNFIDAHGKSAINFQLSLLLYLFLLAILIVPIAIFTLGLGLVALAFGVIPFIFLTILLIIQASLKASNGEYYRYPFTIDFLK